MNPAFVYAAPARNPATASRGMHPAWRLQLLVCLGVMLSPTQASSEDSAYWIDACATPITLILHGLPNVAGVALESTFEICRAGSAGNTDARPGP